MAGYTRNPTPQNYGGSYTPKEPKTPEEATKPKPFFLKEKISEMMKYGMPLVDTFPRRERKLADILRDSMLEMYRLATRLERKYYKKTTLEDLDIELAVLKEFVIVASDKDYRGQKYAPPLTLHQREVWSSFNREIGCMIGGYMESVKNGPAKKE